MLKKYKAYKAVKAKLDKALKDSEGIRAKTKEILVSIDTLSKEVAHQHPTK